MGLRFKLVGTVFALAALCGSAGYWVMQDELRKSYAEIELSEARDDYQRLVELFDGELLQRERVLREWRLWPQLRRSLRDGDGGFGARNLGAVQLRAINVDWLGLQDPQGRLVLSAAGPRGNDLPGALDAASRRWLLGRESDGAPCGLAMAVTGLVMLCRSDLHEPRLGDGVEGRLVLVERLDPDWLRILAQRGRLTLQLVPPELAHADSQDVTASISTRALSNLGPMVLRRYDKLLRMDWPVAGLDGKPLLSLQASKERGIAQRGEQDLSRLRVVIFGMSVVMAGLLVMALDRLVLARLVRMRRELAGIRERREWFAGVEHGGADEIGELGAGVNHLLSVIDRQVFELEKLSQTDALTGLANRRSFNQRLALAVRQQQRQGEGLCLVLVDVDHFKPYNDHYGHAEGDQALQAVASCLQQVARRPTDLAARLGGEEFALLLQDTSAAGALHCAQELQAVLGRRAIAHAAMPGATPLSPGRLSLSIGIALFGSVDNPDTLYQRADAALYRAKANGRDRIECA